jgi:hypothetical protein
MSSISRFHWLVGAAEANGTKLRGPARHREG